MTWVIVAGALGVTIITGGLFLRRLLGELKAMRHQIAEQGRQITGIDRQVRRQRAHVTVLRQLLEDDGENGPPPQAIAVNGDKPPAPADAGGEPVRRKKHLGLYLGGAIAALATIATVARQ
ncbi:hypothetical protein, partial [Streptomyces sp. Amel2xC10]|uniref:hypothetical protein n=1 Tax=Streptomyces sp. Amel2xC10 TaxID=1305826 RepID=UPI000A08941B